jgi:hypothetical protein
MHFFSVLMHYKWVIDIHVHLISKLLNPFWLKPILILINDPRPEGRGNYRCNLFYKTDLILKIFNRIES